MKFWVKLNLCIIVMIAVVLSCSRFIMVRQNFRASIENSANQNMNQHRLERYSLESNMINQIQLGEEVTSEKMVESIEALYSYLEENSGKVALYTEKQELIFCNFEPMKEIEIEKLLEEETDRYCVRKIQNQYYMLFSSCWTMNQETIYRINCYDITPIYEERNRQISEIMYADMIILVIASSFICIFSKLLTRPIEYLNKASKEISSGKFQERVNIKTTDEIGELADSFNKMAEEIEHKINSLKFAMQAKDDFVTGFSHEIKTPMTAIIGYADLLRLRKCDEQTTAKALNYIYSEAKRLEELSYKMLALMELTEDRIELERVQVKEVVEKIAKKIVLENMDLKIVVEEAFVKVDQSLLEVVIRNLVQNSQKAEPKDNCVWVKGELLENQTYRISVIDGGKGIPKEQISRVTENFYMVDKSRNRQNGGTGIGLSLCKKILELHQSELVIESEEGVGTKVSFELEVLENEE